MQYHLDNATDVPAAPVSALGSGETQVSLLNTPFNVLRAKGNSKQTFYSFPKLPIELRTMIWRLAYITQSRVLEITAYRVPDGSLVPSQKSPAMWNNDQNSRKEAKDIHHCVELCLPGCNFIYNPDIDLLYISHRTKAHFHRQDVFAALRDSESLGKVRALAVDYLGDSDNTIPGWDIDPLPLSEMKGLELIFVVLEDMEEGHSFRRTPFTLDPPIEPNYNRAELDKLVGAVEAKWRKEWKEEKVEKPALRVEFVWERGY